MSRTAITKPKRRSTGSTKKKARTKKSAGSSSIRTLRTAVAYLDSLTNYERVSGARYNPTNFGLARMNRLLAAVGNPHRQFKSVHIAGSKGKGSTVAMVSAMLRGCGLKVGVYTSPHILNVRERICIGDSMIPESAFIAGVAEIKKIAAKAKVSNPTYFEVLTAVAFRFFAEQEVDIAVVEVGMGGRLDCTNVITPEVAAITNISYDHIDQLGPDLKSIAAEKAGIIKKGIPVVSAPQADGVTEVISRVAEENEAPLTLAEEGADFSYRFEFSRSAGRHARICMTTKHSRFEHLHVPLPGEHQAANCSVALRLIDILKQRGFELDDQAAMAALGGVKLAGRMEMISEDPRILVDGAHNASSIDSLMRAIGQNITYDSMVVIFGCAKDKDIPGMLKRLQIGADKIIFTSSGSPRSADPNELAAQFSEVSGRMAQVGRRLDDAMQIATGAISREDLICVTGSFHMVAEATRKFSSK